ncbi:unnamed protein product [Brugia timori]|uniref:Bm13313 n=2 Tax=Brugia TaxID=6278 RepID=A0A0J9Y3Z2_BRUMA|nr:Bm13313 [Brugia malayi]VDO09642.1 unnamed protein product [Brugia timori]
MEFYPQSLSTRIMNVSIGCVSILNFSKVHNHSQFDKIITNIC